jgi:hypothetical protein
MDHYVAQLLEDLAQAAQQPLPIPDYKLLHPDHPAVEYGLDYIVAWEMAPDIPMPVAFGLPAEALPPPELLTEAQAAQLCAALLKLWEVNRIGAVLPEPLPPASVVYRELRRKWQESTIQLLPDGCLNLEFCDYEVSACPWGPEFCMCLDYPTLPDDLDDLPDPEPGALPF